MNEKQLEIRKLVNDFVEYSMRFISLAALEGFKDEKNKMLGGFVMRFKEIFNNFKSEKDIQTFYKAYQEATKGEKRALIEFLGYTKDKRFVPFLLDTARSGNFHSIDSIISLGQMGDLEAIKDLEEILETADNEVLQNVIKSVVYTIKKKNGIV